MLKKSWLSVHSKVKNNTCNTLGKYFKGKKQYFKTYLKRWLMPNLMIVFSFFKMQKRKIRNGMHAAVAWRPFLLSPFKNSLPAQCTRGFWRQLSSSSNDAMLSAHSYRPSFLESPSAYWSHPNPHLQHLCLSWAPNSNCHKTDSSYIQSVVLSVWKEYFNDFENT